MRISYHGPDWRYETQVRVFYSRSVRSYAFIQRQPRPLDIWWLTMFATCWTDGSLLLTNNGADEPPGGTDFVVQGMETTDLSAVEELHRREQTKRIAAGMRPDVTGDLETLLAATAAHAGPAARIRNARLGRSYLATRAAVHVMSSVPAAFSSGIDHWAVPITNVIIALMLGIGESARRRQNAAILRDAVRKLTGRRRD